MLNIEYVSQLIAWHEDFRAYHSQMLILSFKCIPNAIGHIFFMILNGINKKVAHTRNQLKKKKKIKSSIIKRKYYIYGNNNGLFCCCCCLWCMCVGRFIFMQVVIDACNREKEKKKIIFYNIVDAMHQTVVQSY